MTMDIQHLIEAVEKKNKVHIDQGDPVFVLATISEELLAAGRKDLKETLENVLDQATAFNIQAEASAKMRAEDIINASAEWAAGRIRHAGEVVESQVAARVEQMEQAHYRSIVAAWILAGVFGLFSIGTSALLLLLR